MGRRNLDDDSKYIPRTNTIDLDKLTLKEFKKYIIKKLSVTLTERQGYLTTDPLTEKYLFYWAGQYRLLSVQVVKKMLKKGQLKYYSEETFRIKDMIVSKAFKIVEKPKRKKKKRCIW